MNYYDEVLDKINKFIDSCDYNSAYSLLKEELSLEYVPKDYETKFFELLDIVNEHIDKPSKTLSDDEIKEYLFSDPSKQLIAVNMLYKKNLRDYIELINEYLLSDGFVNAKVYLIDSLIRQEISDTIKYKNDEIDYEFIPKYLLSPEDTDGFLIALDKLNEYYLKEPSKLELAKELLYKEVILMLPINPESQEGDILFEKIRTFIEQAFN